VSDPLVLPEDVRKALKQYYDNYARGFFPVPRDICREDIIEACVKNGLHVEGAGGWHWITFPQKKDKNGKSRFLLVTPEHQDGVEETVGAVPSPAPQNPRSLFPVEES
jgi:hypothetical protein